jgi:hypothetical protein
MGISSQPKGDNMATKKTPMKCVNAEGYRHGLTKGRVYDAWWCEVNKHDYTYFIGDDNEEHHAFNHRFVPVDNSLPSPTHATKVVKSEDDDKKVMLNFFKRRPITDQECPCGSTRGVCPDHR